MQLFRRLLLGGLFVASGLCNFSCAEVITGRVIAVSDGDTLTILDTERKQYKIRLGGIDAPEMSQSFGQRSKRSLSDLVFTQTVEVETHKSDRYGRLVGKVLHQGTDINLQQVRLGMAWHYKDYANEQSAEDRETYAAAEEAALNSKLGLWSEAVPMPPWAWRKKEKRN